MRDALPVCSDLHLTLVKRVAEGDVFFSWSLSRGSRLKERVMECVGSLKFSIMRIFWVWWGSAAGAGGIYNMKGLVWGR